MALLLAALHSSTASSDAPRGGRIDQEAGLSIHRSGATRSWKSNIGSDWNESSALASATPGGCHATRQLKSPAWSSEEAARLAVGIKADITTSQDLQLLQRSLCSIRAFHPSALLLIVGSANAVHADKLHEIVTALDASPRSPKAALLHCRWSTCTLRAVKIAAAFAAEHGATHFAFMQQQMNLLQPLPLHSLECPFTSFQVRRVKSNSTEAMFLRNALGVSASHHRLAGARQANRSSAGMGTMPALPGGGVMRVALRERGMGEAQWLAENATLELLTYSGKEVELVPGFGFVCNKPSLLKLLSILSRLLQSPVGHTLHGGSGIACDESFGEKVLAAVGRFRLASPTLMCNLDGCAQRPSDAWSAARTDEAVCQAAAAIEEVRVPDFHREWQPPPACDRMNDVDAAEGNANFGGTLLQRFVGPPARIAREIFVGLTPGRNGSAIFGAAAMARLEAEPPEARRVLIYLASFSPTIFDSSYSRTLNLPQARDIWLVRDAAILMLCNNHAQSTANLLSLLRRYAQRSRWLIHSPKNPGTRFQKAPGYLCGEMSSLAATMPVWSRYEWVLHTHADVYPTPELFARLAAKLSQDGSGSREPSKKRSADLYLDRFPGGARRRIRFAMEFIAFRAEAMLSAPVPAFRGADGVESSSQPRQYSAFAEALQTCLVMRGVFPEDLLHLIATSRKLIISPLGAVNYPVFSKLYNTRVRTGQEMATIKTDLFPGAVWHNHNYSQLDAYMKEREVNASLTTAFDPTPERRAAGYPYEVPRTG